MANDISFEIIETIATLSETRRGWKKEINLVSWNGKEPKYDIRDWDPEHEQMGKGVTLTKEETLILLEELNRHIGEK